jgi:hypothetical protein
MALLRKKFLPDGQGDGERHKQATEMMQGVSL